MAILIALALVAGCKAQQPAQKLPPPGLRGAIGSDEPRQPGVSNTDPCAMQMHDLSGALLLFYATRHRVPESLEELRVIGIIVPDGGHLCPTSGRPYLYDPECRIDAGARGRVVVCDATPAHAGYRWAVTVIGPQGPGPLVTKVVALPESLFKAAALAAPPLPAGPSTPPAPQR